MKILSIGSDRSLFDDDAPVRARLLEQVSLVAEMHVIVFTPKGEKFKTLQLGRHLTIHPTSSASKYAYLPDAYRIAKELLEKEHVQGVEKGHTKWLITTQDPFETGLLGYVLSRQFHIPLHLQLHTDPFSKEWQNEKFSNHIRFLVSRFILRRAESIRVVSERTFRSVAKLGVPEERMTKVPIFVDVENFAAAKPTFDLHRSYPRYEKIVLSIGRLQPEKNYNMLIRAFAKLRRSHHDAMLLIVGSGPERDRLLSIARSLEIHEAVAILPWARDVASYYKTCDIYVQPSLYEGWGMAVIEAMASGAPVVMTDVGCAGEIVRTEETGLVVKPGSEQELVFALDRLLSNNALRLKLSGNSRQEVKKLATKAQSLVLYLSSWEKAFK